MTLFIIEPRDHHVRSAMEQVRAAVPPAQRGPTCLARAVGALLLAIALLGLPAAGVALAGFDVRPYLAFPPRPVWVEHAPFSWAVFLVMAVALVAVLAPLVVFAARTRAIGPAGNRKRFPWWGWAGALLCVTAWAVAWTRIPALAPIQRHTYIPLWISYIIVVNAVGQARSGRCMMLDETRLFLALFPVSAAFWWFFEYLNRFVQNWSYLNIETFTSLDYVAFASLSFATVLPAVLGTRDVLMTFGFWTRFDRLPPLRVTSPRRLASALLAASVAGLLGLGVLPDGLFPLVWIAPGLLIVTAQVLSRRPTVFEGSSHGKASGLVCACAAALVCGVFWEMWNYRSLAKWVYHVPFVQRFGIFEMPLLGYAGYLPFGIECLVVGEIVRQALNAERSKFTVRLGSAHAGNEP